MPLIRRDGTALGTLCALDTLPANLDAEQLEIFGLSAELIAHELEIDEQNRQRDIELKEAERVGDLREKLFDILGHDLRNPLNTISMAAKVLSNNKSLQPQELSLTGKIINNTQRMNRMIADLLDLTRTRLVEGIPINRQFCDLNAICLQISDDFSLTYPNTVINFESDGSANGFWDADRLAQVLSNLIGNAVQHGTKGTPIDVKLGKNNGKLTLSVRNQGKPIPPDSFKILFDPFRRAIENQNKQSTGLGLGLYIVQQIVQAHQGEISVESNETFGTTFFVTLPLTEN